MNTKIENFKNSVNGKQIAVIGIGISNIPAIKYLASMGAHVTALDKREVLDINIEELKNMGITFILGTEYLSNLSGFDYILRSPGVKPFTPELEKAVNDGAILTSEIELLMELAPCKIVRVTGSDGKTTTTTLISMFLKEAGFNVWLGGNIGTPLFSKLDEIKSDDIIVLELSSFQLMTAKKSPDISVITNISPNHLDYHRSYDEYIEAKENIFLHQQNGTIVLNSDDKMTEKFLKDIEQNSINSNVKYFSLNNSNNVGCFFDGESVCYNDGNTITKIEKKENIRLVGIHNIANICAAASAVIDMTGFDAIRKIITTFNGVKHRMEHIATIRGIKWYNDSIGTSPSRTMAGLNSFDQKIILIAGGYDKHIPYDVIGNPILNQVKHLVLIGATAPKIKEAVINAARAMNKDYTEFLTISEFKTLEECVNYCDEIAKTGDIVVMSPASASFDMYKNFEERGEHFCKLVETLKDA